MKSLLVVILLILSTSVLATEDVACKYSESERLSGLESIKDQVFQYLKSLPESEEKPWYLENIKSFDWSNYPKSLGYDNVWIITKSERDIIETKEALQSSCAVRVNECSRVIASICTVTFDDTVSSCKEGGVNFWPCNADNKRNHADRL